MSHEVSGTLTDAGDIDALEPACDDAKHRPAALTGWGPITCILLADMFGLGALTLPSDLARLGWAPGLGAIVLAGAGMLYTGLLFTRLAISQPRTGKFDDWGFAAYGRAGRLAVYVVVYGAIMGEPTVFQITCVEVRAHKHPSPATRCAQSIKQITISLWGQTTLLATNLYAGLVIALVMWPLAQLQGLEEVSSVDRCTCIWRANDIFYICSWAGSVRSALLACWQLWARWLPTLES